jgi:protein-S-isoprenylcysteine O-methyltransferase Ste14
MKLYLAISVIWLLSEVLLARTKLSTGQSNKVDKLSLRILWITIILFITLGILVRKTGIGFIKIYIEPVHYSGIFLIILGIIIRWIAIHKLKSMFTVDVSIQKGHKIVKSGIYKIIRHPAYLGSLLSFLGLGIALVNWLSIIIIFVPILIAFVNRIYIEEKVLCDEFGEEYLNYSNNTYRLFPGIY